MPNFSSFFVSLRPLLLLGGVFLLGMLDLLLRATLSGAQMFCNPGIGWGIALSHTLILILNLVFLLLFVAFFVREKHFYRRGAWLLILVGGFINFLDRLLLGCVRDYLHTPFFPSFNLADMMLTLGVGVIIFLLFFRRPE